MADNVVLNSGDSGGATIATDDDGTAQWQLIKLGFGGDGTFTRVASGAGLPVDLKASVTLTVNAHAVTNAGTFAVQSTLQAGTAEIGKLAAGVAEIGNVKNSGTFATQATLQAGTAAFGKLSANSGVDIGDVDVTSYPGPADAKFATLGQKNKAGSTPVTLATDEDALNTIVTNAGTFAVQSTLQAGTAEIGKLAAGTAAIGKLAANSGVDIGDVDVTSISAGSNLIGDVGLGVRTSGGTTPYKNLDVDESEDEVKATAGQVYWIHAINLTAGPLYLKFYNLTAANTTVGTSTPVLTLPVPANADSDGAGFTLSIPNGIAFSTAITIAGLTGVADNDTTGPAANKLIVNLGFA